MHVEPEPLLEHVLGNQQPVRGHDDRAGAEVEAWFWTRRLQHANAQVLGRLLRGWCAGLLAAPAWRIGPRQQRGDLVAGGETLEHVRSEGRRRCDGQLHFSG